IYEAQAVINIFGGINKITTGKASLFSTIGNSFGVAGQSLMSIYACYKMVEEGKKWKETEAELQKLLANKNINDLAKGITKELLAAKRNNHQIQTFGNAALSVGQAMMTVGGPIGLGLNPLLYTGLAATLGGVAANAISDLKYQGSYKINENIDALEKEIITKLPKFSEEDFKDINKALAKCANQRILELEILGHLRAPQFVLYQKYSEKHKDDVGILSKAIGFLGGSRIAKWFNRPPDGSIKLVENN